MQVSARSYLTAGVAFVGASAIALTPVAVVPDSTVELRAATTHTANLSLVANPTPLQVWVDVLQKSVANVETLTQSVLAAPAPVIKQVAENQLANASVLAEALGQAGDIALGAIGDVPDALRTGLAQIASGDIQGGVATLMGPIFTAGFAVLIPVTAVLPAITTMAQNFANAVSTLANPVTVLGVVLGVAGPIMSALNAVVDSAQGVVDGLMAGDFAAAVDAVVNVPAVVTGAILNGHGSIMGAFPSPGLLSPVGQELPIGGIFAVVQSIREQLGLAIAPPAPAPMVEQLSDVTTEGEPTDLDLVAVTEIDGELDTSGAKVTEVVNESDLGGDTYVQVKTEVETGVITGVETGVVTVVETGVEAVETGGVESVETGGVESVTAAEGATSVGSTPPATSAPEPESGAPAAVDRQAEREAKRAERAAEREAKRAEREAEREAKQAEREAKREAKRAEREASAAGNQAGSSDAPSGGGESDGSDGNDN